MKTLVDYQRLQNQLRKALLFIETEINPPIVSIIKLSPGLTDNSEVKQEKLIELEIPWLRI